MSIDQPSPVEETSPERVLNDLIGRYNLHDATGAAALYAPEGTHVDVATGKPKSGDAIQGGLEWFLSVFPDARWVMTSCCGSGTVATCEYVLHATLQKDLGSIAASGQRLSLPGVFAITVQAGLIVASRDYWDYGTFKKQLGMQV